MTLEHEEQEERHLGPADEADTIPCPPDLEASLGRLRAGETEWPEAAAELCRLTPREFVEHLEALAPPLPIDGLDRMTIAEIASLGSHEEGMGKAIEHHYHVHIDTNRGEVNVGPVEED